MLSNVLKKARSYLFYKTPVGEVLSKVFDIKHHLAYGFKEKSLKDKMHMRYYLTKHYHIVEKGLSLPQPRPGFGQPKIRDIIEKTKKYERNYGADELVASIRRTLSDYLEFNESLGSELPAEFKDMLVGFLHQNKNYGAGGVKSIQKEFASSLDLSEFANFAMGRVSVRNFSDDNVSVKKLYTAVDVAKSAPSVCNRQGWKTHCYSDSHKIKEILAYQNGNAGFTEVVNKLLIVTADAKAFTKYESNQLYIDGGLFSMNLLLALHAAGYGACPLNTCYPFYMENRVKRVAAIPDSERLIMMIAVGCLKDSYTVAYSNRNPTDEVFVSH